jgi:hypothetical protein
MGLLKKCQDLYEELKTTDEGLAYLEKKLSTDSTDPEDFERLYEEEFKLAMAMVGCFEDLMEALDKLDKEDDMKFNAMRIRQNATKLMKIEVIHVSDDI